jgi:hypothetical protein
MVIIGIAWKVFAEFFSFCHVGNSPHVQANLVEGTVQRLWYSSKTSRSLRT